jgi:molybdenum cofactor cytidylyltransferase
LQFGEMALDEAVGAVLAHGVRGGELSLKKGRRLSAADVAALRGQGLSRITAVMLDADDVPEDEAAAGLARAMAGPHIRVAEAFTGRVNLHALEHGLLVVDAAAVDRVNAIDEAVTVATLPAYTQVAPGQMVATIKIIPFAVPRRLVEAGIAALGERPLAQVAAFRPLSARLVQTVLPGTTPKMLDKTVAVTRQRLEALDGKLLGESRCEHDMEALAAEIAEPDDADLLLIAGASAITDRRDVLPAAIEAAGGEVLHFGMPVDPGNLILLGRLHGKPVLGLPGCARSPKLNGFDWVLQRIAAGIEVTGRDIMRMGVGGLLTEIPTRPQPREGKAPKPVGPTVAAVVLAAGQSRRMGSRNKLLIEIDGKAMARRAVEAALAARCAPVVVVTGHMREQVEAVLAGLPVRFVHNAAYAEGLSTSLKAGIEALPDTVDAAVVCLGDMPRVTGRLISSLIAAYNPTEGRSIVVPTHAGKRGNPVLWGRELFAEMREIAGDVGAKGLIGRHDDQLVEVEMGDDASLVDIDTPEALRAIAGAAA